MIVQDDGIHISLKEVTDNVEELLEEKEND